MARVCMIAPVRECTVEHEHAWLAGLAGRFLVFDGPDGSGKSTQLTRFGAAVHAAGVPLTEVREPGGTAVGERIREILLDPIHDEMTLRAEMMLYMASRSQLVEETIRPALAKGHLVVADRFVSSTFAYQGSAGGLPEHEIIAVAKAACGDTWPDLVLIFDVDGKTAASRLSPTLDRIEQRSAAYHQKVREGFLGLAQKDPDRHVVIDACATEDGVTAAMMDALRTRLAAR